MDKAKILMCLEFAEGKRGKFTIYMSRNANFPNCLIEGTEKQRTIMKYVNEGKTTRQIGEIMGCSHATIAEHIRNYKRGVEFHDTWCEFWEYIKDVREMPIEDAFGDIISADLVSAFKKNGIIAVGDFLLMVVTVSKQKLYSKYMIGYNGTVNGQMFDRLRLLCIGE